MSFAGVIDLFRSKPRRPLTDDGRMPLGDHLRELRARMLKVSLFLVVGTVIAWFFYGQLFELILGPYNDARAQLGERVDTRPIISGVADPLLIRLKISALAAIVLGSPFWLYQIWAFVVPGLHPHEKRWTKLFSVVAGPLFIAGVAVGYYVLPKGLQVLISFTPADLENLVPFTGYFSFFTRMLLVFGIAFEIPLFVVLLNFAGVISGRALAQHRPWIILGTFVFAAVATPSTDPFSMVMLAIPVAILFFISELVAKYVDRRRAKRDATSGFGGLSDDEASPLTYERDDSDDHRVGLGREDD